MVDGPQIPGHWKLIRLGQYVHRPEYGYTVSAITEPVGPKLLRITDIQDGGVDWKAVPHCHCDELTKRRYLLCSGDIVVARIGATTGKAYLLAKCPETIFASYLIRIRPKAGLEPEFLNYFLQSKEYWGQIERSKGGRLKGGVNIPVLEGLELPLPPLSEQRAIARILRAVQAAREARQREVSLERERKAALMAHLFTHGTRGEPTKQTPTGEVPRSWEVVRLAKCAYIQTGTTKGRRFKGSEPTIEVPYLRVANVQDGYLDLSEIKNIEIRAGEYDRYRLQAGDVLMTEGGDADKLGRGFIWNDEIPGCVHQNHVFAVRVNKDLLTPEFLSYQTQSPYGKAYFLNVGHRTTNLASINSTKLGAYPVLLAPRDEQERIVDILSACDAKIAALERESALLDELFRALLEELMTGRVAVAGVLDHETAKDREDAKHEAREARQAARHTEARC